ncbi:MAG: hypothetical protein GY799_07010 [Desulfobulbaceae bacterium]|nr:hypothetical protein [Desulfobulbaceae bacterium]
MSGEVFITNPETTIKAVANMRIIQGDSIQTGANSSAGLIFLDGTVVALGHQPCSGEKGVDSTYIKATSHWEENLLIKTADIVHEPKNRRVEVVFR